MSRFSGMFAVVAAVALSSMARADVWDNQTQNDNTVASENELIHGSDQLHDLAALAGPAADQDFFRVSQRPYSSYEAVVDATSGDIGTTLNLDRTDAAGVVQQSSTAPGLGFSRSIRFFNNTAAADDTDRLKVTSGSCTTTCTANDVYRIRFYETTYSVPRFNNSGTQVTVLVLQNPASYTITGTIRFWAANGTLTASNAFSLPAKNILVLATQTVAPGTSGAITITNDGRFGDLSGKTVALEPATGFSFDSPMIPRIH